MEETKDKFLQIHQNQMEHSGFWEEKWRGTAYIAFEMLYKTEIIRVWQVVQIVDTGDKMLIKWAKRFQPLTDEELKDTYGR